MSNSPLVSYTKLSPNHSGKRAHKIDTISIHCMAANASVESCGALFARPSTKASSNYGIGSDGRIALYVEECNRSWCTSSASNDHRAITIEVANNGGGPDWPVSDKAMASLIDLLVDICKRNGIPRLLWRGDPRLIGDVEKQNMTVHRWFAKKACPGDYLYNRHGWIASEVNKRLEDKPMIKPDNNEQPSEWAKEAADFCIRKGIINGDGEGHYGWKQPLTREAGAQMIYNILDRMGVKDAIPDA